MPFKHTNLGSRDGGRALSASVLIVEAESGHMFGHNGSVHMFCQYVAGVVGPSDFLKGEIAFANPILHPYIGSCKVPNFPKSASPTDADGGTHVRQDRYRELDARSLAMDWSPRPCAAPLDIPVSSASADLSATVDWVVDQCLIR